MPANSSILKEVVDTIKEGLGIAEEPKGKSERKAVRKALVKAEQAKPRPVGGLRKTPAHELTEQSRSVI